MALLDTFLEIIAEEAAAGATAGGDVAVNQGAGFSLIRDLGSKPMKGQKKIKIKKIFKEDDETLVQADVMSKIKKSEKDAEVKKDLTGFALEDDEGKIMKVYVNKEEAGDFEEALNTELMKNQNDEFNHREIGEVLFDLKKNFEIVNIEMDAIPEDEEEDQNIEASGGEEGGGSGLKLDGEEGGDVLDKDKGTKEDDGEKGEDELDLGDEMEPGGDLGDEDLGGEDDAKSALNAVIDMMTADAKAKEAEANAKAKEAEARIAELNTKAAEAQVKKSEEMMDMETFNNEKSTADKESKELTKLAQYRHDMKNDAPQAKTDFIPQGKAEEEEEVESSKYMLKRALTDLLRDSAMRN